MTAATPLLRMRLVIVLLGCAVLPPAMADDTVPPNDRQVTLPVIQVNASRLDLPPFDVPAALSVVTVQPSSSGQPGVNFSEALVGIPGILARDRQNYAQDEQISIRGFGARATFGVRSMRLYVDGVPATMPDGQGQVSHFNLDSADRVEVLRGPFSALYGNAAGGVVQLWSADGTAVPQTTHRPRRRQLRQLQVQRRHPRHAGPVDYNIAASQFLRPTAIAQHSRARRESANAKFGIDLGRQRKLTLVLNRFYQPQRAGSAGPDPRAGDADPRQATPVAKQYDTRKSAAAEPARRDLRAAARSG